MKIAMLSPFERTCLHWISRGWTVADIALIEGKDTAEIQACVERAVKSLNAESVEQALEKVKLTRSG
ncbi:hypothetical protein E0H39_34840 [Rhizobium leguminosarum bv. viciae]|nr:hypothetical protein [Rhizobium sp. NZLR8]MBY5419224.1 hypothetical protein [Rhizobium leguminosarum]NKK29546.1 hypothetical protein [Rhizobium leguminosarum bv. viciae]NKM58164.1 hypothetical protein [Rhizobium anhuiense]OOO52125.1 hypothetical protein BS629_10740 [Rhizobium leguminosarum bv. viciae USDA 2370]TCA61002.1 hypothetical protein E0J16_05050 [Rhizobium pisi]